jgi:hypothetical protein
MSFLVRTGSFIGSVVDTEDIEFDDATRSAGQKSPFVHDYAAVERPWNLAPG